MASRNRDLIPVVQKSYDLCAGLYTHVNRFPRAERGLLGRVMLEDALQMLVSLTVANRRTTSGMLDDFLLLAADRSEARDHLDAVRAFLTEQVHLELNPRRVIVAPIDEPCDLLGYVHHPGGRVRVRRRSVRRLWRRLLALARRVAAREIDSDTARASVASWFGLAAHADTFRLSKSIFTERDVENIGKRLLVRSL